MGTIHIKRGLDIPISGKPEQDISPGKEVRHVAMVGPDYIGMKPTMHVGVGDDVKLGQLVFTDKKSPLVKYTAPGAGKIVGVHRGNKRVFLSMVIELNGTDEETFKSYPATQLSGISRETVLETLLKSGQWPMIRRRPFSKVADPAETPHSIFVTAMDSNPLAPSISKVLEGNEGLFENGLIILSRLTEGKIFVCKYPDENIPIGNAERVQVENFSGKHPAGLVGTHIHFHDSASRLKTIWYLNAQDVVKIGHLFVTGKIMTDQVVSLAGPQVERPHLVRTRVGANLYELTEGELKAGDNRIISGSVLSGRTSTKELGYLGRYEQQVSVLSEGREKEFLGWMLPGFDKYSAINLVASKLLGKKSFDLSTAMNGGHRAIVPIGTYEKIMPLDMIPTYLLRALAVKDVEEAEKLGCLELDEEDLALCTFVCQSKLDHGSALRETLTIIDKEG